MSKPGPRIQIRGFPSDVSRLGLVVRQALIHTNELFREQGLGQILPGRNTLTTCLWLRALQLLRGCHPLKHFQMQGVDKL